MFMRGRRAKRRNHAFGQWIALSVRGRMSQGIFLVLAACLILGSAGRFGFKANAAQCPTAPVQTMAIMTRAADGTMVTEYRAPRPGEKNFVVCHCQAKRAATQSGWFVPSLTPIAPAHAMTIDVPILSIKWDTPEPAVAFCDPPINSISHPPSV
jgi:hypothetical protein